MTTQGAFAAALLDPARSCPTGLATWNGSDPAQRFAVYRNNVVVSLIDALADTYPVTQALVGADFFRAMAREFVLGNPPRSPVLAWYGAGFAEFIEEFAPAAGVAYLADVARLEMARVLSFHAADAVSVSLAEIQRHLESAETLPELRINLHPSLRCLASRFAVVSLWAAHQTDDFSISAVAPDLPECALVMRCEHTVEIRAVGAGLHHFLTHLADGSPFGLAAQASLDAEGTFDLAAALGLLIRLGAICSLTGEGKTK